MSRPATPEEAVRPVEDQRRRTEFEQRLAGCASRMPQDVVDCLVADIDIHDDVAILALRSA